MIRSGRAASLRHRYADDGASLMSQMVAAADRFLACFEPTSLLVYGEPSGEAQAALDGFGAAYLGWLGGFKR